MKKIVGIVIVAFMFFMSVVLVAGFLQKNNDKTASISPTSSADTAQGTASNSSQTKAAETTKKTYTVSEVSSHNSKKDCWLIINNNVYNVTSFLGEHPGGTSAITPYCGKEATQAFDTQDRGRSGGHSSSAKDQLTDYYIGTIN